MKCTDCWYCEKSRFGDYYICTVDRDIEDDEPVYAVSPDDEIRHRFEYDLTRQEDQK